MRISCQIANKQKTKNYRLKTLKFGMIQKSETKMHPLKSLQKTNKKSVEDTKPWKDGVLKSWVAIMLCSFEFVVEKKLPAGDFLMIWKSWKSLKIHFSTVFPLEIAKKNPPAAGKISPKIFYRSIFMETFSLPNQARANAEQFYKNCRPNCNKTIDFGMDSSGWTFKWKSPKLSYENFSLNGNLLPVWKLENSPKKIFFHFQNYFFSKKKKFRNFLDH